MTHACYCVTEHNAPLQRMDCPTPVPRGAEVLIRMTGAGVCHSDIHIWEGVYDLGSGNKMTLKDRGVALPLTMGHEISGEVVKAPDGIALTARTGDAAPQTFTGPAGVGPAGVGTAVGAAVRVGLFRLTAQAMSA